MTWLISYQVELSDPKLANKIRRNFLLFHAHVSNLTKEQTIRSANDIDNLVDMMNVSSTSTTRNNNKQILLIRTFITHGRELSLLDDFFKSLTHDPSSPILKTTTIKIKQLPEEGKIMVKQLIKSAFIHSSVTASIIAVFLFIEILHFNSMSSVEHWKPHWEAYVIIAFVVAFVTEMYFLLKEHGYGLIGRYVKNKFIDIKIGMERRFSAKQCLRCSKKARKKDDKFCYGCGEQLPDGT